MNGKTESTSNSIKFAPMPMSALLESLKTLHTLESQPDSLDCSFSCEGDNAESCDENDTKQPSPVYKIQPKYNKRTANEFLTPVVKSSQTKSSLIKYYASEKMDSCDETDIKQPSPLSKMQPKSNRTADIEFLTPVVKSSQIKTNNIKSFASEKKNNHSDHDKENNCESWISNQTYPNQDSHAQSAPKKGIGNSIYSNSEIKTRNALMPHNNIVRSLHSTHKKTPETAKVANSGQKSKPATPVIKSGIRKFTPGSARKSQKKTPQKSAIQNRDRVRCELFTQQQKDEQHNIPDSSSKPPQLPVPETPVNRKPIPASYVATPSYPQGVLGNNSKMLFKSTSIKGKKYIFIKKLGTGGSSEVYKVLDVSTSCEYALKCVNLATDPELAQGYINEVRLLRELQNSDRVVKLFDYEYDRANQFLRLVLEAGDGDLSSVLQARGTGALPPTLLLHYWDEMLHAVHYIHEHGVIHADLKPANFLLVRGRLKLIDFGIASAISSDATSVVRSQATGTYSYISPEALMGGAGGYGVAAGDGNAPIKISFRSDVWSLGCILYSMVYGRTPFGHMASLAKLAAILDPNHRIDYPPVQNLPVSLIEALKWCLTYNARARPSVRELLSIPYLASAVQHSQLPQSLLDKLQPLVTPQEFRMLQARL